MKKLRNFYGQWRRRRHGGIRWYLINQESCMMAILFLMLLSSCLGALIASRSGQSILLGGSLRINVMRRYWWAAITNGRWSV